MVNFSGRRILKLRIFTERSRLFRNFGFEHLPFIILYGIVLFWCFKTIGQQHAEAIARLEAEAPPPIWTGVVEIHDPIPDTTDDGNGATPPSVSAAAADEDDPKKRVPSIFLPGFWALFSLSVLACLNALFALLQIWSVKFKCLIKYSRARDVFDATHVHVIPRSKQALQELVMVEGVESVNEVGNVVVLPSFVYHRRRYIWNEDTECFDKVRCTTDMDVSFFAKCEGITTSAQQNNLFQKFGDNKFEMTMPTFMQLFRKQLLSPFTVFQLFGMILWCLDEYWGYTIFTLCMILLFEATTVFTRLRNLKTLRGIAAQPKQIFIFRKSVWTKFSTEALLPGDIFSLVKNEDSSIACDCILLRGSAVVNEASLTGESIPQMKEGLPRDGGGNMTLNIKTHHKRHVLFGGTTLMQINGNSLAADQDPSATDLCTVPSAPDGGATCYALRTGFASSEGKLVRMLEGSVEAVRSDTWDIVFLLLLLLFFALASSSYVLYQGLNSERSRYELLLHCILIVTSVVPPELPMQMALAVNTSLMTLMRLHVFCTEPFRVPTAGRVDVCCFDKTGTLTSDELVAVGVRYPQGDEVNYAEDLTDMSDVTPDIALVLGACHSLVVIDDKIAGDPLESAALKAIKWELLSNTGVPTGLKKKKPAAAPGPAPASGSDAASSEPTEALPVANGPNPNAAGSVCRPQIVEPEPATAAPAAGSAPAKKAPKGATLSTLSLPVGRGKHIEALCVLHRHHFSSALQRMSVVARTCKREGNTKSDADRATHEDYFVLTKGSAEAVAKLLHVKPKGYDETAANLAKKGMRVIALAYRHLRDDSAISDAIQSRSIAEQSLHFAGFVAFTCRIRKETKEVLDGLKEGGHDIVIVTGDALPTAVHVAIETGVFSASHDVRQLHQDDRGNFSWRIERTVEEINSTDVIPDLGLARVEADVTFEPSKIALLAQTTSLCMIGPVFVAVMEKFPQIKKELVNVRVFARMSPEAKEQLLMGYRETGHTPLMCGDGANDVGALRVADIGVALLSGFGDINVNRKKKFPKMTDDQLDSFSPKQLKDKLKQMEASESAIKACKEKKDLIALYQTTQAALDKPPQQLNPAEAMKADMEKRKEMQQKIREETERRKKEFKEEFERLSREVGAWEAMKRSMARQKAEMKKFQEENKNSNQIALHAQRMAMSLDDMEDLDLPMVKVGDASVAAPFTYKMPSIRATLDIVRQGRCTLVSAMQMYQILSLNCLISAYSLSVLYLDGVKYGDMQMTALGILSSISFISLSNSKPLQKLSPVRPLTSIFHPSLFISILGQFVLHLATMIFIVYQTKSVLAEQGTPWVPPARKSDFKPSLINSAVFLGSAVQHLSVFVVNLKGPPFMDGVLANRPLLYSLITTFFLAFIAASESMPQLNLYLQLVPFPSESFRNTILLVLLLDVVLGFAWDRLCQFIFANKIFRASLASVTREDLVKTIRAFVIIGFLISFLSQSELDEETLRELGIEIPTNTTNSTLSSIAQNVTAAVLDDDY